MAHTACVRSSQGKPWVPDSWRESHKELTGSCNACHHPKGNWGPGRQNTTYITHDLDGSHPIEEHTRCLPQTSSSEESPQSSIPLHFHSAMMHTLFLHCHCPGRHGCWGHPSSSQPSSQSWCRSHSSQCGMQWWVPGHCTFFAPHTGGTEQHSQPALCPRHTPQPPPSTGHIPQSCSSEPSMQSVTPSQRQLLETHRPSSHCQTWGSPPQATSAGTAHSHWDLPLWHSYKGPHRPGRGRFWQCTRVSATGLDHSSHDQDSLAGEVLPRSARDPEYVPMPQISPRNSRVPSGGHTGATCRASEVPLPCPAPPLPEHQRPSMSMQRRSRRPPHYRGGVAACPAHRTARPSHQDTAARHRRARVRGCSWHRRQPGVRLHMRGRRALWDRGTPALDQPGWPGHAPSGTRPVQLTHQHSLPAAHSPAPTPCSAATGTHPMQIPA